jgi:hypothetical protein
MEVMKKVIKESKNDDTAPYDIMFIYLLFNSWIGKNCLINYINE